MAEQNKTDYQKASELAEAGRHQEALTCIERHIKANPDDIKALNDAGAILHCLGRSEEAVNYLVRANELSPANAQIIWNLIEAYLAAQRPEQVVALFDQAQQMQILNPDVLNRTATQLLDQDNKAAATEVLLRSLWHWPGQEILEQMLTVIKSKRPKIAFICGGDGRMFLNPVIDYVSRRFEVRVFEGGTEQQVHDLMQWSDISWFEWCTNVAVMGSRFEKVCKTIVRLHRYEAYLDWPSQVNWQNIDYLITVGNSFVKKALFEKVPQIKNQTSVVTIANGVELDKINFVERQRGKNLAFVGYINLRKNLVFLLQCMQKLHYIDPEYKLFIAGMFQDGALEQYLKHTTEQLGLQEVVLFDGWQDDIAGWLADKHYLVSASIAESQGMGILEGMSAGLKPIIHNFPGADEIYLPEFLFNIAEEFCEQILSDCYEPRRYRRFVEENYSHEGQLAKVNELLIDIENDIDSEKSPGGINHLQGSIRHL